MRPRAFLEPFVSRGTGHLPFTTKRGQARNGQDPVSCSPRVSSSTIYSREQSTNFVVEFIYLLFLFFFFFRRRLGKLHTFGESLLATRNSIGHTDVSKLQKFVMLVFRVCIHFLLRVERRIINRSKEKSVCDFTSY